MTPDSAPSGDAGDELAERWYSDIYCLSIDLMDLPRTMDHHGEAVMAIREWMEARLR